MLLYSCLKLNQIVESRLHVSASVSALRVVRTVVAVSVTFVAAFVASTALWAFATLASWTAFALRALCVVCRFFDEHSV